MPGMAYHIFWRGDVERKGGAGASRPLSPRATLRLRFAITDRQQTTQTINMDPSAPVVVDNGTGVRIFSACALFEVPTSV